MKNTYLDQIIQDFDNKQILDFYDLDTHDTDFEISRHLFKSLRIGYIKKTEVNNSGKAIYINFSKKKFSIKVARESISLEKRVFEDEYSNYASLNDIYSKIKQICDSID